MLDGSFMVPRETPPSSSFRGDDDALQTATILCLRNPRLLLDVNLMNVGLGLIKVDGEDFRWKSRTTSCLMVTELMASGFWFLLCLPITSGWCCFSVFTYRISYVVRN